MFVSLMIWRILCVETSEMETGWWIMLQQDLCLLLVPDRSVI